MFGAILPSKLVTSGLVKPLSSMELTRDVASNVTITLMQENTAAVGLPDQLAINGIVHIIDTIILPPLDFKQKADICIAATFTVSLCGCNSYWRKGRWCYTRFYKKRC